MPELPPAVDDPLVLHWVHRNTIRPDLGEDVFHWRGESSGFNLRSLSKVHNPTVRPQINVVVEFAPTYRWLYHRFVVRVGRKPQTGHCCVHEEALATDPFLSG